MSIIFHTKLSNWPLLCFLTVTLQLVTSIFVFQFYWENIFKKDFINFIPNLKSTSTLSQVCTQFWWHKISWEDPTSVLTGVRKLKEIILPTATVLPINIPEFSRAGNWGGKKKCPVQKCHHVPRVTGGLMMYWGLKLGSMSDSKYRQPPTTWKLGKRFRHETREECVGMLVLLSSLS